MIRVESIPSKNRFSINFHSAIELTTTVVVSGRP
jgi:hypothetical protein